MEFVVTAHFNNGLKPRVIIAENYDIGPRMMWIGTGKNSGEWFNLDILERFSIQPKEEVSLDAPEMGGD